MCIPCRGEGEGGGCDGMDNSTDICCDDTPQHRPENAVCCGSVAFDSEKHMCCEGAIQPGRDECCGVVSYDTENSFCCGDVVVAHQEADTCCGNSTYSAYEQYCCGDVLVDIPSEKTCCGNLTFDGDAQVSVNND
ncbi:hypothetical protein NP493_76g04000 [Ridgeia piscesae]|uniref:Galaxin-like repeats domain-containing protein n=1 Tax=Ridgeia piscesae TaxID=27915 RepID=A0AAD9UI93_RIDPI|nr:hypothetical protein NP493_76g04000 [Ridgeia piscesae]